MSDHVHSKQDDNSKLNDMVVKGRELVNKTHPTLSTFDLLTNNLLTVFAPTLIKPKISAPDCSQN
jgi:hypothetical protein